MMTKQEALRKIFPEADNELLASIWSLWFQPELSEFMGEPFFNPVELDNAIIKIYGEYEGSLKDFITNKFGEEVFLAVK
jgi:hypothetical protein